MNEEIEVIESFTTERDNDDGRRLWWAILRLGGVRGALNHKLVAPSGDLWEIHGRTTWSAEMARTHQGAGAYFVAHLSGTEGLRPGTLLRVLTEEPR